MVFISFYNNIIEENFYLQESIHQMTCFGWIYNLKKSKSIICIVEMLMTIEY